MQSNICAKVTPLLREKQYNISAEEIFAFLSKYRKGQIIYPGVLYRKFNIDIKTVYAILKVCKGEGLVVERLEIYCPCCQRFTGYIYNNVGELPEVIGCPHCDEEIQNVLCNALVIYEVL